MKIDKYPSILTAGATTPWGHTRTWPLEQAGIFSRLFPKGMEVTAANFELAFEEGLQIQEVVRVLLGDEAYKSFGIYATASVKEHESMEHARNTLSEDKRKAEDQAERERGVALRNFEWELKKIEMIKQGAIKIAEEKQKKAFEAAKREYSAALADALLTAGANKTPV